MTRILIADADDLVTTVIEEALRARGYSAHVVGNAEDAIRVGMSGEFDLLILDLALPWRWR